MMMMIAKKGKWESAIDLFLLLSSQTVEQRKAGEWRPTVSCRACCLRAILYALRSILYALHTW
jgi:hypothetical protein